MARVLVTKKIIDYAESKMEGWFRDTVYAEAVRFARAANMPDSFVRNIRIVRRGPRSFTLRNTWSKKDKYGKHDLAKYFEFGTRDHFIKPRFAKVLAWRHAGAGEGSAGRATGASAFQGAARAIYSQSTTAAGTPLFSKGHYVTGLPKTLAMTRGSQEGKKKLKFLMATQIKDNFRPVTGVR